MGYYTNYTLTASVFTGDDITYAPIPQATLDAIKDELEKMAVFDGGDNLETGVYAYTSWCDHDKDMRLLSARFPELLFYLHGEGDNVEDMWNAYYLGGRSQLCRACITYEDFDVAKLLSDESVNPDSQSRYSYQP